MNAVRCSSQSNHYSSFRTTVGNLTTPRVTKAALAAFVALANFFIFPLEMFFPISLLTTCSIYLIGSLWDAPRHQQAGIFPPPFTNPPLTPEPYFSPLPTFFRFPSRIPVLIRPTPGDRVPIAHHRMQPHEPVGESGRRPRFAVPMRTDTGRPAPIERERPNGLREAQRERESIDPTRSTH